ncbi:MAG: insulinase family protein [PVC group bacterium]|nr:insulinase family protein [PVC group bacterium]
MYKSSVLPSGLQVISLTDKRVSSVSIGIWIGAGSRYESAKENGVSHFLEHLVFKGTKKRTYRQIKESIEGVGGILNGFTAEELTCYLVKVIAGHMDTAIDVLMDIVVNPRITLRDIEKERHVVFEEIKMYYDLPRHLAYDKLVQLLWPAHPLGRNIAGTFDTLKKMSRKDILSYKKSHYSLKNIVISACGNITHEAILQKVKKFLRNNPIDVTARIDKPVYKPVNFAQKEMQTCFLTKDIEQTHCYLGVHALHRNDPLRHALTILHIILGANMSSRLFNEIREKKGLAYDIGTGIKRFSDTGAFVVHAGVKKEKTEDTLRVILKELKKTCQYKVTSEEFTRARAYYTGQILMGIEDTLEHMLFMGESLMIDGAIKNIKQIIREIEKVRPEDIQKVARLIFIKNNMNLAVVGPLKKRQAKTIKTILDGF